jgi:hypothetical protein
MDYVYSCEWETVFSVRLEQRIKQQVTKCFAFYENINERGYIPFYVLSAVRKTILRLRNYKYTLTFAREVQEIKQSQGGRRKS